MTKIHQVIKCNLLDSGCLGQVIMNGVNLKEKNC